jgi:hypothetical protein
MATVKLAPLGAVIFAAAVKIALPGLAAAYGLFWAAQAHQGNVLEGEAAAATGFGGPPAGKWPVAVSPTWTAPPRPDKDDWELR